MRFRRDLLLIGSVALLAPSVLTAAPLYPDDCTSSNVSGWTTSNVINYYVENNFNSEFNACTPVEANVSSHQLRTLTQTAAEVWNNQSRGPVLVYGGTTTHDDPWSFCNDMSLDEPGIFVNFTAKCDVNASGTGCVTGRIAVAHTINDPLTGAPCPREMLEIKVVGSSTDIVGCSIAPVDWHVGVDYVPPGTGTDLHTTMIHEFGHTLGLGHPSTVLCAQGPSIFCIPAAMTPGNPVSPFIGEWTDRSLYPWDVDCSIDYSASRVLDFYWAGYDPSSNTFGTPVGDPLMSTRVHFSSGGHIVDGLGDTEFALYEQYSQHPVTETAVAYLHWTDVDADGDVDFDTFQMIYDGEYNTGPVDQISTMPLLAEYPEWNARARLSYPDMPVGGFPPYSETQLRAVEPPAWKFLTSDDHFHLDVDFESYSYCDTPAACGVNDRSDLRSRLPLTSAWNPVADGSPFVNGRSMFGSVATAKFNPLFNGLMYVYPGFNSILSDDLLSSPAKLDIGSFAVTPSESDAWDYEGETDTQIGVACDPLGQMEHNCILAWVDRGIPSGRILYTYFSYDVSEPENVAWHDTVYRRSGAYSASGVSAAYFDGRFWMAWKGINSRSGDVAYTSRPGCCSYSGWGSVTYIDRDRVVNTPTWLYDSENGLEAALVWTEY